MRGYQTNRFLQRGVLLLLAAFLLIFVGNIFYRSQTRASFSSGADVLGSNVGVGTDDASSQSDFQLTEFHRVEVKDGKRIWEIEAFEAKYYPEEELTHVNDARVVIHQEDGTRIVIRSKGAKLHMPKKQLSRAELEGDIVLTVHDEMVIHTETATYDVLDKRIFAPGIVSINGRGFEVDGIGMEVDIAAEEIQLLDDVTSLIHANAEVPRVPSL